MLPEKVNVHMVSKEYLDGECFETKDDFNAKCYLKNGKIYLCYKEQISGIDDFVSTLVTIDENSIQISRKGAIKNTMRFIANDKTRCDYITPLGVIEMIVDTSKYVTVLQEDKIEIFIDYTLEMNGTKTGLHKIFMKVF